MADYDAIVVGAGHNGLTAATVLAKNGLSVLCLEKNNWIGGMAATRELFDGFKHNVGAWALLIFRAEMIKRLELDKYGLELVRPRSSRPSGESRQMLTRSTARASAATWVISVRASDRRPSVEAGWVLSRISASCWRLKRA